MRDCVYNIFYLIVKTLCIHETILFVLSRQVIFVDYVTYSLFYSHVFVYLAVPFFPCIMLYFTYLDNILLILFSFR